ncbi:hypothetical protein SDC9_124310 [bioreactor metagenome]|uniref:Uncharacterized protein n=1 Tax=bioreactor metagenome TaxID=1076179 RepID=A0A645CK29_9ZZZZ|nr:hypothetical protein [Candidatus Metalachnospira sp.]
MKRLKEVYRCVVCGGDMHIIKFDKEDRKVYYRCIKCGYEETLTFEEAGVDDEDYGFFILKEDGTLIWECPDSGLTTENVDGNTDFEHYYDIDNLCPDCCE